MRLLSYNIHKGIGGRDRLYRLKRIIRVIEEENPDLICLQEVTRHGPRSPRHDQPGLLARHFQLEGHAFQMNVRYKTGGYGNLILSRWPFLHNRDVSLKHRRKKTRGAQLVVADTPEGPLHLGNMHLGLAEKERFWQVNHLLKHELFEESGHLPTLLVGDYNDWRNRLGPALFASHDFHQVTAPVALFRSFPAFLAVMSLDKAFTRGGVTVHKAQVVNNPLSRQASDHLPLLVDFHLTPPPPAQ